MRAQGPPDVRFRFWVTATDSGYRPKTSAPMFFGLHPNATYCVDTLLRGFSDHWFEDDSQAVNELLQYPPCAPGVDVRMFNTKSGCYEMSSVGRLNNIHQFHDTTESDTVRIKWCVRDSAEHPLIFRWPSVLRYYFDSVKMTDPGDLSNINMLQDSSWTYHPDQDPIGIPYLNITMWGPKIPPGPPAPVVLTSPANGDSDRPLSPTLTWNAVPGASYYRVQVDTVRTFNNPLVSDTLGTTLRALTGLAQGKWYYWRVLVSNQFGVSLYQNPPDSFKTMTLVPVAPPIIATPLSSSPSGPLVRMTCCRPSTSTGRTSCISARMAIRPRRSSSLITWASQSL